MTAIVKLGSTLYTDRVCSMNGQNELMIGSKMAHDLKGFVSGCAGDPGTMKYVLDLAKAGRLVVGDQVTLSELAECHLKALIKDKASNTEVFFSPLRKDGDDTSSSATRPFYVYSKFGSGAPRVQDFSDVRFYLSGSARCYFEEVRSFAKAALTVKGEFSLRAEQVLPSVIEYCKHQMMLWVDVSCSGYIPMFDRCDLSSPDGEVVGVSAIELCEDFAIEAVRHECAMIGNELADAVDELARIQSK